MEEQDRKSASSWSSVDVVVEIAGVIGIALLLVATLMGFNRLPGRVPVHFGFAGEPDRWGDRAVLLVLPAVGLLIYAGLSALTRFPQHFNYPWPITSKNAERQYLLARRMLRILKVVILWVFMSIFFGASLIALGTWSSLPPWLLLAGLGAITLTISWYFMAARQAR